MSNIKLQYTVTTEQILRDFMWENEISKKTLTRIKFDKDGKILVNNKEENVRYKLKKDDIVTLFLPSENFSEHVRYFDEPINILYEDEYLMIIDKPKNLPTIPSRNNDEQSLLERINYYFKSKKFKTIPHVVTRLDKNTTGLVLIAKHRHIHAQLSKINIDKYYLALATGKTEEHQIIEKRIARKSDSIIERCVQEDGEYAKTELTRIKYYEDKNFSLIKLKLFTGRTHQIRVHCSHLNHPLLGDELYGGKTNLIDRQALHCHNLKFIHPITKNEIDVSSDLPEDMNVVLKENIMNEGQKMFYSFIMDRVKVENKTGAEQMLQEGFEKQNLGEFTLEYLEQYIPKMLENIVPEKIEEVKNAMESFKNKI